MELQEALEILQRLADGFDPIANQPLLKDNPCQHPQVIRALYTVIQEVQPRNEPDEDTTQPPGQAGKLWSEEEEAALLRDFGAGASLAELAKRHGRTTKAIYGRLYRLGKVPPWPHVPPGMSL
jgi:hypothetical protein